MTIYTLEREQFVTASLDQAWSFLENPANLNMITPEDLNFSIISPLPKTMYNGLIIEYRIAIPLVGVQKWIAEIKHIREKQSFVDEQRLGPYTFWYHYHELNETAAGVKVFDRVNYVMPFGPVGTLLHGLFFKRILGRIFDYRKVKIAEILGQ